MESTAAGTEHSGLGSDTSRTLIKGPLVFVSDSRCERFLMTCNPKGYLKRIRPEGQTRPETA